MKKVLILLFLCIAGLSVNSCGAVHTAYHIGEAAHYVTSGGPYPYRYSAPLNHSIMVINSQRYCNTSCRGAGTHYYYSVPQNHTRYLGSDSFYYCLENCPAPGPHDRLGVIYGRRDVYREARDVNYYNGYYRAEYEYRKTLYNQAPVIRYHKPLRKRVRSFW